ncbi:MAG TPA: glycosyl hydrolase family 18 protein [Gemmatimonadaceae bacterium]|nr:glycosyl hydrolase family 18 protein [Gemmatimonadaceae bacterium]
MPFPASSRFALSLLLVAPLPRLARAQAPEALWYLVDREESVQSFLAHADRISVVAPQVYSIDSTGVIWGSVDGRVLAAARAHGVKVVPLVVNPGFDQALFHRVLSVPDARQRAVRNLAALCRDNHFAGIQFDFENVSVTDRDAFTAFARESADSLHALGCTLSAAVVPRSSEFPGPTSYHSWIYHNWRGVYDYKALADVMDFLSLMTYAEHTGGTTPGPVAGYPWMERALAYVLSLGVPPAKISLGLPSYSAWWFPVYDARTGPRTSGRDISYATGTGLLARYGVQPLWDDRQKTYYAFWDNDGVNEFLFLEDARAFAAKLALVRQHHLRGYSVWVLGLEDPRVWEVAGSR